MVVPWICQILFVYIEDTINIDSDSYKGRHPSLQSFVAKEAQLSLRL